MKATLLIFLVVAVISLSNALIHSKIGCYRRSVNVYMMSNINNDNNNNNNNNNNQKIIKATSMFIALTLPAMMNTILLPQVAYADKSYKTLNEPTAEFIEETKKTQARNEADQKVRKEWDGLIEKLKASDTADGKETTFRSLIALLKKNDNGIPTGVKKIELVKLCRSLKYDNPSSKKKRTVPSWTTSVEIAYEDFIKEFNKQITPKSASDNKF